VRLRDVEFSYGASHAHGRVVVLRDVSLSAEDTAVTVIVGPSGCGKTTLLNLMAGILSPSAGTIISSDEASKCVGVGYVFQNPTLIPWRTISANCVVGAELRGDVNTAIRGRAARLLAAYGLLGFEKHYPSSISGGMQQRVAIIRAIVAGSKVLLLDEPFSDSDFQMRRALQQDLSRAVDQEALTAILVTHDLEEAVQIADRIIVLTPKPARVAAEIEIPIPRARRFQHRWSLDPELFPYLQQTWAALDASCGTEDEVLGSDAKA